MKKTLYIWLTGFIILIILALAVNVESSLRIDALSPNSANLCGIYEKSLILTATGIENIENSTFENVTVKLIVEPAGSGLFIANETVILGDIAPLSISPVKPSWEIYCDENYPGNYKLYVNYYGLNGFYNTSKEQATSIITVQPATESTPPKILKHLPTGKIVAPYITLEITTDEEAICRYSTSSGVAYDNMIFLFDVTGGTTHRKTITGLMDNTYHYYVKCMDSFENKANEDYKIIFDVDIPPTASIELNKPTPLRLGLVEITVRTSEDVKPVPILSYSFDSSTKTNIPLSGSGSTWTGYLLVQSSGSNNIGSFYFSSMDLTGNTGNTITSGNLFLIDTEPPDAPIMVEAREKTDGVKLTWRQNEDVDHYTIYRSTSSEPGFVLYDTTKDKSFLDARVTPGEIYYYRICAVDLAGNEGSPPEEVQVAVTGTKTILVASTITLPASENINAAGNNVANETALFEEVNAAITTTDYLLEELNSLREKLKEIPAQEQDLLGIPASLKNNKVALLKINEDLAKLKTEGLGSLSAVLRLKEINAEIKTIKSQTLKDITYGAEETDFTQNSQTEQILAILRELLQIENIQKSEWELDNYISKTEQFQENIEIKTNVKELSLTYLNGSTEKAILIKKEIIVKDASLANFLLIENIPKTVAKDVIEIAFDSNFQVVKADPVLKRSIIGFNTINYVYLIKNNAVLESALEIKTITFPNYQEFTENKANNLITSLSVSSVYKNASFYDAGIALGLILIISLTFYFFIYTNKNKFTMLNPPPPRERPGKEIKKNKSKYISKKIAGLFEILKRRKEYNKNTKENDEEEFLNYSFNMAQGYQEAGLISLKHLTIPLLIEKVDSFINSLDSSRAFKLHYILLSNLELNPSEKSKIEKEQITRILKKANLLQKINLLHFFAEQKEIAVLKCMLNDIAGLYNELIPNRKEQERNFFEKTKQIHDTYSRIILNK